MRPYIEQEYSVFPVLCSWIYSQILACVCKLVLVTEDFGQSTPSLYLYIVLFWLDNDILQPKRFAKILKYCQFADICMLCF